MKRIQIRKSEVCSLNRIILENYGLADFFNKKDNVVVLDDRIILKNGVAVLFYYENRLCPTLRLLLQHNFLKKIVADSGAIKFISNGADLMRPGIVKSEEGIKPDEVIAIVDHTYNKPIAVGIALYSSEDIGNLSSGKIIKNIHYVGDYIWNGIPDNN